MHQNPATRIRHLEAEVRELHHYERYAHEVRERAFAEINRWRDVEEIPKAEVMRVLAQIGGGPQPDWDRLNEAKVRDLEAEVAEWRQAAGAEADEVSRLGRLLERQASVVTAAVNWRTSHVEGATWYGFSQGDCDLTLFVVVGRYLEDET